MTAVEHKPILNHQDWFQYHAPVWKEFVVPNLPPGERRALEIGSFEGRSALWIVQNLLGGPPSTLTCVDTWDGKDVALGEATARAETVFDHNMGPHWDQVIKCKMESIQALANLIRRRVSFHFVYIDGNHEGLACLTDLVMGWSLLLPGGILVLDDYRLEHQSFTALPKDAWDAFASTRPAMEILHTHRQQIARKLT